jgi:uncharacterized RDD family membrane protein YckC
MEIESKYQYVGFWRRAGAKLIDVIALGVVTYIGRHLNGVNQSVTESASSQVGTYLSLASFYYFLSWWKFSGTLGNYLLGQRVVGIQYGSLTSKQTFIRVLLVLLSECLLSLPFLTVGFDSKKQGVHDKAAGTYVIAVE